MSLDKHPIFVTDDDFIAPEETFIDSMSDYSMLDISISPLAFKTLYFIIFLFFAFFTFKAFRLQIINGSRAAILADKDNASKYSVLALRGIIDDAQGRALVENIPVLDLVAFNNELPKTEAEKQKVFAQVADIIGSNIEDIDTLVRASSHSPSFIIKDNLPKEEVLKIQHNKFQGIYVLAQAQRNYLDGPAFAHVLGYTAKVSEKDIASDPYYLIGDRTGRLGLEGQYETTLRGEHKSVLLNNDELRVQDAFKTGSNLQLTIDKEVQDHLYQAITSVFRTGGVKRGAAVVQDSATGAILGLVSIPSFDPNIFEAQGDKADGNSIAAILKDTNRALFNRVIGGRYSSGSTIKPLYALIGLEEGIVNAATRILANGSISVPSVYDKNVIYTFHDWKVHGWTDIRKAIADSVDIYFYALGGGYGDIKGLGIKKLVESLRLFRADQKTGIDLPGEVAGFVPSEEWKEQTKGASWFIGDTYNLSIGQGDLVVTPLWINSYISALANNGKLMKPYVVKNIQDNNGNITEIHYPQIISEIPMQVDALRIVKEGMRQTVTSGTAQILKDLPVPVAAKTGTAQVQSGKNLNSLFTVFGPYDNPRITMTVVVEEINKSQGLAMQVAREFLMWYFSTQPK